MLPLLLLLALLSRLALLRLLLTLFASPSCCWSTQHKSKSHLYQHKKTIYFQSSVRGNNCYVQYMKACLARHVIYDHSCGHTWAFLSLVTMYGFVAWPSRYNIVLYPYYVYSMLYIHNYRIQYSA